ncbi:MAG: antitoxin [Actinobacteria bacterium]|nr:antitoxin [Actinomycetota bacterium]
MGLFDKVKGLVKGREKQINQGIDKVADVVESKIPDQHDAKVEQAAEKAKDFVDKLDDTK